MLEDRECWKIGSVVEDNDFGLLVISMKQRTEYLAEFQVLSNDGCPISQQILSQSEAEAVQTESASIRRQTVSNSGCHCLLLREVYASYPLFLSTCAAWNCLATVIRSPSHWQYHAVSRFSSGTHWTSYGSRWCLWLVDMPAQVPDLDTPWHRCAVG